MDSGREKERDDEKEFDKWKKEFTQIPEVRTVVRWLESNCNRWIKCRLSLFPFFR
jgi:hypothetical protein